MKEEIPPAAIDGHVKNATNRSEERTLESATDENSCTGRMRLAVCVFKIFEQSLLNELSDFRDTLISRNFLPYK